MSGALLGIGTVRHRRLRPAAHAFAYSTYFLMLPMRALRRTPDPALARNRFGLIGFHDRDHGDGGPDALAWLESMLAAEGVTDADGEVWLQTYPRVLGYVFKPVSFWYCHRADGSLAAVLVEVNNTFGERHCLPAGRARTGLRPRAVVRARSSTSRPSARCAAATASASCARPSATPTASSPASTTTTNRARCC